MPDTAYVHKAWLGLLTDYRVGLVVSAPALAEAQAWPDPDMSEKQQRLLGLMRIKPKSGSVDPEEGRSVSFSILAEELLDWDTRQVAGFVEGPPLEEGWTVLLPEYHETLRPSFVLLDGAPREGLPLLVGVELADGQDFDAIPQSESTRGWEVSPQTKLERLLRGLDIPLGIISNGRAVRLAYVPKGESPGHITFPLHSMCDVAGRPILAAFHMLLSRERLRTGPHEQRLAAIVRASRLYQANVSSELGEQVLLALFSLVRGFQSADEADPRGRGALLHDCGGMAHIHGGLITVLMRVVFILYAEDRGLLSSSGIFTEGYSLLGLHNRLREEAGHHPDSMHRRFGAWAQLIVLFRLLHDGARHRELQLPARHGELFDPDVYPFLEGRRGTRQQHEVVQVPLVPDSVVLDILDRLLYLGGERVSYSTLDVEQIGSVYEGMMGYSLELAVGRSIAVRPDHVVVNLDELLTKKPDERATLLTEAGCKLTGEALKAWKGAANVEQMIDALGRRISPRTPVVLPLGAMYLQPSEERRRSGSHYTPRSLTGPIVEKALTPILARLAVAPPAQAPANTRRSAPPPTAVPTPEAILGLKVCDPAMGSGAFLVEACRFLGDALVQSWDVHGGMPEIPQDEDRVLHARRLIAQRCLYGVDKNPFAVNLAKLSLWLFTLAKEHPFTFLDHALRHGDSLVGLSREQVANFDWKETKKPSLLVRPLLQQAMERTEAKRRKIQELGDVQDTYEKEQLLQDAQESSSAIRAIADLAIAAYFSEAKDKAREDKRKKLQAEVIEPFLGAFTPLPPPVAVKEDNPITESTRQEGSRADLRRQLRDKVAEVLAQIEPPVVPFHWELEFPEVFTRENGGFDSFVGNPPFMGVAFVTERLGAEYVPWLQNLHSGTTGKFDLVAHFFRRAADLLGPQGTMGFIATNTISQGDTRATGLVQLVQAGFMVYNASINLPWPGIAGVTVSVVHLARAAAFSTKVPVFLDGKSVANINTRLTAGIERAAAEALEANNGCVYVGNYVLGMGFTLTPDERQRLIAQEPKNAERIFPFMGGEEVNSSPEQAPNRYIIDFGSMTLDAAACWGDLLRIVRAKVKPERDKNNRAAYRERWWRYAEAQPALRAAIAPLSRCLVNSQVSKHLVFAFQPTNRTFAHTLYVYPLPNYCSFAILQSRVHVPWAWLLSSSMKTDLRYAASDCFETFPFPQSDPRAVIPELESIGEKLYEARAKYMIDTNQGLTKTYNAIKDRNNNEPRIFELRELHEQMDRAVLDAYGWGDVEVPPYCPKNDEERAAVKRFEDEVIDRLFALNAKRAAEEKEEAEKAEAAKKAAGGDSGKGGKAKKKK